MRRTKVAEDDVALRLLVCLWPSVYKGKVFGVASDAVVVPGEGGVDHVRGGLCQFFDIQKCKGTNRRHAGGTYCAPDSRPVIKAVCVKRQPAPEMFNIPTTRTYCHPIEVESKYV